MVEEGKIPGARLDSRFQVRKKDIDEAFEKALIYRRSADLLVWNQAAAAIFVTLYRVQSRAATFICSALDPKFLRADDVVAEQHRMRFVPHEGHHCFRCQSGVPHISSRAAA
jgi:hypothetical protein